MSRSPSTSRLLAAGIVAGPLFVGASLVQAFTRDGFDLELTRAVSEAVDVPVIASGGAGGAEHVAQALGVAQAALLASILHENPERLGVLRDELRALGVPLRDAA